MMSIVEVARERSARLEAEIGEVSDFIRMAKSW